MIERIWWWGVPAAVFVAGTVAISAAAWIGDALDGGSFWGFLGLVWSAILFIAGILAMCAAVLVVLQDWNERP